MSPLNFANLYEISQLSPCFMGSIMSHSEIEPLEHSMDLSQVEITDVSQKFLFLDAPAFYGLGTKPSGG